MKFFEFEDCEFSKQMGLVEFYEIAEELIIALQYFKIRQKESDMIQRLNSFEKFNDEIDKSCLICLDRPNNIVLSCTHAY
mmetsp:Transcript_12119/g.12123  ORF Transcript_12119/g.12123 Transcript_12119/m.12123 type:complete len:80 (-) Transcript_12119:250-489(-)